MTIRHNTVTCSITFTVYCHYLVATSYSLSVLIALLQYNIPFRLSHLLETSAHADPPC